MGVQMRIRTVRLLVVTCIVTVCGYVYLSHQNGSSKTDNVDNQAVVLQDTSLETYPLKIPRMYSSGNDANPGGGPRPLPTVNDGINHHSANSALLPFVRNGTFYKDAVVNPLVYKYSEANSDMCNKTQSMTGDEVFLLILVISAPDEEMTRYAIRMTWGNATYLAERKTRLIFLVGRSSDPAMETKVRNEINWYHDMVKADFIDNYHNLPIKTLVGLNWVVRFCGQAKFVLKLYSDTLLNLNNLLGHLSQLSQTQRVFEGHLFENTIPVRETNITEYTKWQVTSSEYPFAVYPPYVNGPSYVISRDLVHLVVTMSEHVPYLKIEDVYIGMVMQTLGVVPQEDERYTQIKLKFETDEESLHKYFCYFSRSFVVSHNKEHMKMLEFWPTWKKLNLVDKWINCGKETLPYYA